MSRDSSRSRFWSRFADIGSRMSSSFARVSLNQTSLFVFLFQRFEPVIPGIIITGFLGPDAVVRCPKAPAVTTTIKNSANSFEVFRIRRVDVFRGKLNVEYSIFPYLMRNDDLAFIAIRDDPRFFGRHQFIRYSSPRHPSGNKWGERIDQEDKWRYEPKRQLRKHLLSKFGRVILKNQTNCFRSKIRFTGT